MKTAIYPGTFDPITNGHLDLIRRASQLFDRLVIAVASNPVKNPVIPLADRVALVKAHVSGTVEVKPMTGLLVEFAKVHQATVIVRGVRCAADMDYELLLANANRDLSSEIETVFLSGSMNYAHISSSVVREVAALGGDVSLWVPAGVADYFRK